MKPYASKRVYQPLGDVEIIFVRGEIVGLRKVGNVAMPRKMRRALRKADRRKVAL